MMKQGILEFISKQKRLSCCRDDVNDFVIRNRYGIVIKFSELISIKKIKATRNFRFSGGVAKIL